MRVLLADDDPVICELLRAVLVALDHDPVIENRGDTALARWEAERFPMVLLDLDMPGVNGLEVCRRIRATEPGRETYILVLTGRDSREDLEAVLDAGADDYMTKPQPPERLRARLMIAGRRMEQDAARRRAEAELARARWLAGIGETTIALQHEINNPLSAVLGHAELLQFEQQRAGEHNEHVEAIVGQAKRIADVVKRIGALRNPKSVGYLGDSRMIDLSPGAEHDDEES